ncbi:MAG: hypothetical protein RL025_1169, partial [Bacteroidota bacterium]
MAAKIARECLQQPQEVLRWSGSVL